MKLQQAHAISKSEDEDFVRIHNKKRLTKTREQQFWGEGSLLKQCGKVAPVLKP